MRRAPKGDQIFSSLNPSKWRGQLADHLTRAITNETRIRTRALDIGEPYKARTAEVHDSIGDAVSAVVNAGSRFEVISEIRKRVTTRCVQLALIAAPVTAAITRPDEMSLPSTVMAAITSVVATVLGAVLFVGVFVGMTWVIRYENWLIPLVVAVGALRVAALAGDQDSSLTWLPNVLQVGWVHIGLIAASWVFIAFAAVFTLLMIVESWGQFGFQRTMSHERPKQWLIYKLTQRIADLPALHEGGYDSSRARRQHMEEIERIATRFERDWSMSGRTKIDYVERAAREWASRVAGAVRSQQGAVRNQTATLHELRRPLSSVAAQIAIGVAFDGPAVSRSVSLWTWWRRGFRIVLGLVILLAGLFPMAAALSQPGFPELLTDLSLMGLADTARLSDELRVGAGSLGVILIGYAARLLIPRSLAILLVPGTVPNGVEPPRLP
jgi:hypothetical protein